MSQQARIFARPVMPFFFSSMAITVQKGIRRCVRQADCVRHRRDADRRACISAVLSVLRAAFRKSSRDPARAGNNIQQRYGGYRHIRAMQDRPANGIPSIKVVKSESMSKKHPENKYLTDNDLNDQFQMFDVVVCNHLPAEDELKLYDIVVYKQEDLYIIHRIVGIEEPNANHPGVRHFLLQGDAVENPDKFPVLYSQMQGIYEGNRIPFIGSFILFLQSPAGWLCVLLVIFSMVVTPIVEKKIKEDGSLVTKEYVKGRGNVYTHPAISEYNKTSTSANQTVATLIKIFKSLRDDDGDNEGEDELLKALGIK